jgi:hypothetical protein
MGHPAKHVMRLDTNGAKEWGTGPAKEAHMECFVKCEKDSNKPNRAPNGILSAIAPDDNKKKAGCEISSGDNQREPRRYATETGFNAAIIF